MIEYTLLGLAILTLALIMQGRAIVAAIDDLTAAVSGLETASAAVVTKINTLKAVPGIDPAQVETLVARVNTVTNNLNQASA